MSGRDGAASVIKDTWKPYHDFSSKRVCKHRATRHRGSSFLDKHGALRSVRHLLWGVNEALTTGGGRGCECVEERVG